jgi:hypothetical protein
MCRHLQCGQHSRRGHRDAGEDKKTWMRRVLYTSYFGYASRDLGVSKSSLGERPAGPADVTVKRLGHRDGTRTGSGTEAP